MSKQYNDTYKFGFHSKFIMLPTIPIKILPGTIFFRFLKKNAYR
uniref:Uncharacterized protein n=1 Tax=Manihot esculenta TaxID=3983 RepID=A0A2C9V3M4_MANES